MSDELLRLRARAERNFPGQKPSEALARVKAVVGPATMPADEEGELANEALEALRNLQIPTPKQVAALEKMIRLLRPAPRVVNGRPEDFVDPLFDKQFPGWKEFQGRVSVYLGCVGRVDFAGGDEVGSGVLVAPDILLTNSHVLMKLSHGTGVLEKGQAVIFFQEEDASGDASPIPVLAVKERHKDLDMVLLEVEHREIRGEWPVLAAQSPKPGAAVVAVGFPAEDSNNPLFMRPLFGDGYEIKRTAPGEIIDSRASILFHDCSTLGGNSGSPLFSMETAEMVALHQSGAYLWRNEAIEAEQIREFAEPYCRSIWQRKRSS